MGVFYHVVLFALVIVANQCEEHLYAHGPFGKAHLKAEIPSPFNCNRSSGIFSRSIHSKSVGIIELKVSSTNYSNAETIYVSWTPSPTPCTDDFIGVYFLEIPVETGEKKLY
jgi:hypothetical protein